MIILKKDLVKRIIEVKEEEYSNKYDSLIKDVFRGFIH